MVKSVNTANIPIESILKAASGSTSTENCPSFPSLPAPCQLCSLCRVSPASPAAPTKLCSVRQSSLAPSHNGNSVTVAVQPREEGVRRSQVTFSPVILSYSSEGQIGFVKIHPSIPGLQTFRNKETSRPLPRRTSTGSRDTTSPYPSPTISSTGGSPPSPQTPLTSISPRPTADKPPVSPTNTKYGQYF